MLFQTSRVEWLIVGLGNPGSEYARTRHNVGFRAADALASLAGVKIDRAKFRGLSRTCELGGHKVLLLKPETFMNNSGEAVQLAAMYYKIPIDHIVVVSDDISGNFAGQTGAGSDDPLMELPQQRFVHSGFVVVAFCKGTAHYFHQIGEHHLPPGQPELPPGKDRRGGKAPPGL